LLRFFPRHIARKANHKLANIMVKKEPLEPHKLKPVDLQCHERRRQPPDSITQGDADSPLTNVQRQ
jgi:hypothetical protein